VHAPVEKNNSEWTRGFQVDVHIWWMRVVNPAPAYLAWVGLTLKDKQSKQSDLSRFLSYVEGTRAKESNESPLSRFYNYIKGTRVKYNPTPSVFGVSRSDFKGQSKQAKRLEQSFELRRRNTGKRKQWKSPEQIL